MNYKIYTLNISRNTTDPYLHVGKNNPREGGNPVMIACCLSPDNFKEEYVKSDFDHLLRKRSALKRRRNLPDIQKNRRRHNVKRDEPIKTAKGKISRYSSECISVS